MIFDRSTIIRLILLVAFIFAVVYFSPKYEGQNNNNNSDMVIIDFYHNIRGFEYANDIVILHDNKRNATCWIYNRKSISCISDKDLS